MDELDVLGTCCMACGMRFFGLHHTFEYASLTASLPWLVASCCAVPRLKDAAIQAAKLAAEAQQHVEIDEFGNTWQEDTWQRQQQPQVWRRFIS